ncbi:MAG: phosphotransferase [Actinomycetota bacterium]|nr:phosphotransferase [Actinomycetota bacterium]
MARMLSPLELLHPDGASEISLVLGSACPASLRPGVGAPFSSGLLDLIIVAPTRSELRTRGWILRAARVVSEALAEDGVVYVLAPRGWRARTVRALSSQGLAVGASFAHLPNLDVSRYLVPLATDPASYAFSSVIAIKTWKRRLTLLVLSRSRGRQLLARCLPAIGFAMRRTGARPLFDWVFKLDGGASIDTTAVVTTSWRRAKSSFVLHRFSGDGAGPTAVAKIGRPSPITGDRIGEAKILGRLAPGVSRAGAEAPELLVATRRNGRPLMLESVVPGRSAAVILSEAPQQLSDVWLRVSEWLQRWNCQSLEAKPLTEDRLASEVIGPAKLLAHLFEGGDRYAERLEEQCARLVGESVPFTAAHNDLTMANLLFDEGGRLGVVDWESAREDSLPLMDFYYAMVDAASAANRYADRPQAFRDCFTSAGRNAPAVDHLEGRLRRALGLSTSIAELGFHACWLHHAANEDRMDPSASRPFLSILRCVASDRFSRLPEISR